MSSSNVNEWPLAMDHHYHVLQPSAPMYPTCSCCHCLAFKKCNLCNTTLCLEHESRIPIEKEWCITFPEKTYYSTLVLCSECREKEISQRRFKMISASFGIVLFVILLVIFILSLQSTSPSY